MPKATKKHNAIMMNIILAGVAVSIATGLILATLCSVTACWHPDPSLTPAEYSAIIEQIEPQGDR